MNLFGGSVHSKNQEGDEIIILMWILKSNNSNWSHCRIPTGAHFSRIQASCRRSIGNAVVGVGTAAVMKSSVHIGQSCLWFSLGCSHSRIMQQQMVEWRMKDELESSAQHDKADTHTTVCYQTPITHNNYRGTAWCNINQVQDSTPWWWIIGSETCRSEF
jgi:hypothetical protein